MNAQLLSFVDHAPGLRQFRFSLPELTRFTFNPGQFISLSHTLGEKKITRAYSIASLPADDNCFEICLNRVGDGVFSPHLFAMEPGDQIEAKGPLGVFVWREPVPDAVLVATGTGVVPFRPMLYDSLRLRGSRQQMTLIYGTRFEQNLLYLNEFRKLEEEFPNFRFIPTVTRPGANWTGATGRVLPHVLEAVGERRDIQVYACGLKEMVDDVRDTCKVMGFDRRHIVFEKYD